MKQQVRRSTAARMLKVPDHSISCMKFKGKLEGSHGYVTLESIRAFQKAKDER